MLQDRNQKERHLGGRRRGKNRGQVRESRHEQHKCHDGGKSAHSRGKSALPPWSWRLAFVNSIRQLQEEHELRSQTIFCACAKTSHYRGLVCLTLLKHPCILSNLLSTSVESSKLEFVGHSSPSPLPNAYSNQKPDFSSVFEYSIQYNYSQSTYHSFPCFLPRILSLFLWFVPRISSVLEICPEKSIKSKSKSKSINWNKFKQT